MCKRLAQRLPLHH
ncbi:hypothetical protein D027_1390A, partial [Vibrio parahaemolyticus 861]